MIVKTLSPNGGGSESWGHNIWVEIRIEGAIYIIEADGDRLKISARTDRGSIMESHPTGRNSITVRDIGPKERPEGQPQEAAER